MPTSAGLEQDTPEWHEWRRRHLGGSDAATIMWLDAHCDPYRLWLEKTGQVKAARKSWSAGFDEAPTVRGKRLEPEARNMYCAERGCFATPECLENDREGETHMAASLDGRLPDRIIEIKCPSDARIHLMAREGHVPEEYATQIEHNMRVADVELADYVSYFNGELVIIPFRSQEKFRESLIKAEQTFWSWVEDYAFPFPDPDVVMDLTEDTAAMESLDRLLEFRRMREEVEEKERIELATLKRRLSECGRANAPQAVLHWEQRKGWIQWREIPEVQSLLRSRIDLSPYRGPDSLIFRVERK